MMDWSKSKRSSFSVGSLRPNFNEYEKYPNVQASPGQTLVKATQSQLPVRSAYYETHWPLFCSDWTKSSVRDTELVALTTYREDAINKIEIIEGVPSLVEHANGGTSESLNFTKIDEANVNLPITKLQWDPDGNDRFITSSDRLKLWGFDYNNQLVEKLNLVNGAQSLHNNSIGKHPQSLPPLTSLDWNKACSNIVITSSIDTTCTVWDLNHPQAPTTQLIAHDSEVFDVQFLKGSANLFASVGNDGSMRVFDLRSLDHSTIIYEPPSGSGSMSVPNDWKVPLLRLAASNVNENLLATFGAKSDSVKIMDMRYPAVPTHILSAHSGHINSIKWHPNQGKLLSSADDCQALIWDMTTSKPQHNSNGSEIIECPISAYGDTLEINNVTWAPTGDWFGVVSGKGFQGVRVLD